MTRPLVQRLFPGQDASKLLPTLEFAQLPTPVEPLPELAAAIGAAKLYVKRDDQTGALYGGNKVRKLEFLLGAAKARGAKTVLTFGAAGSNHCLATATYARHAGMNCIAMLVPQHNAKTVRRNLLAGFRAGMRQDLRNGRLSVAEGTAKHLCLEFAEHGILPSVFPAGGSSPLGCLGYVNAALELAGQVAAGVCPEPDWIYVPSGTMGTAIGLLQGLLLTPLRTRVMAIAVTSAPYTSAHKAEKLFGAVNNLLHELAPEIPRVAFPADRFQLRQDFLGEEYALYTPEGMEAVRMAHDMTPLKLEGTYTGKALAALIHDARAGRLSNQTTLFWDTYSSVDIASGLDSMDYHALPTPLHRFFEEPVQELDR